MTAKTEQATREFAEAFNDRDTDAMVERTSPDCVIVALRSQMEGAFKGHEGVREWATGYFEAVPDVRIELERVDALGGGRVLVLGRQAGTAAMGGASFDAPLALIVEIDGTVMTRLTAYPSREEAVEAAGLDP